MRRRPRVHAVPRRHRVGLVDRYDPYLIDEFTFTRDEILRARAAYKDGRRIT